MDTAIVTKAGRDPRVTLLEVQATLLRATLAPQVIRPVQVTKQNLAPKPTTAKNVAEMDGVTTEIASARRMEWF